MRRNFSLILLLCSLSLWARADEAVSLPGGLHYVRGRTVGEALTTLAPLLADKQGCVLDLRYVGGDPESAASLQRALSSRSAQTRLYVLVSPETPVEFAQVLETAGNPGLFTLGIAGSKPRPTVVVKTSASVDRSAYAALSSGTPITELISGRIEKERFDEAALVSEFKSGNTAAEPPLATSPTESATASDSEKSAETVAAPAPVRDHVLQRAVNLQQALLALRRS